MKVSIDDFKKALAAFEAKLVKGQDTSSNKFAIGAGLFNYASLIDDAIASVADESGMIDVGKIRATINAGLEASGGELVIEPEINPLMARFMRITIKSFKFTKEDFDEFFTKTIPQVSPSAVQ